MKGKKKKSSRASYIRTMEVVSQIREELQSLKRDERVNEFEFTLWNNTDSECAYNYNCYFPHSNPRKLSPKNAYQVVNPRTSSKSQKKLGFRAMNILASTR